MNFQFLHAGTHGSYDATICLAFARTSSALGGVVAAAFQGWAQPLGCDSDDIFCWVQTGFCSNILNVPYTRHAVWHAFVCFAQKDFGAILQVRYFFANF